MTFRTYNKRKKREIDPFWGVFWGGMLFLIKSYTETAKQ